MPTLLPGTLRLSSADGAALEVAAGTSLPAKRSMKHRTSFSIAEWALEIAYRTATGDPHERRLPLLPWDGSSPAGRDVSIDVLVTQTRVAFVDVSVDGGKELYRFDPIALRDDSGRLGVSEKEAPGGTIVERGFSGTEQAPSGNFRVSTRCDACARPFSMRVLHAGHAGVDFFYCEKCPSVTSVPLTDPRSAGFWKGIESKRLDLIDAHDPSTTPKGVVDDNLTVYRAFEEALAPCRCGGRKRFLADLRCPHCSASYVAFRGDLWRRLSEVYVCHVAGHDYVGSDGAWRRS